MSEQQKTVVDQYPQASYFAEDEIDLRELFLVLWRGKWWMILITGIFAISSLLYALSLPDEYKSTAILAPASSQNSSLNSLANQFGGLASLAGVNIGPVESSDDVIAIELIKTWGFAENYINKHGLAIPLMAAEGWDAHKNQLIIDSQIYDINSKKWVREVDEGKSSEPSSWELFEIYSELLFVQKDDETGLVRIGFTHYSPYFAKEMTDWLIQDVNALLKERALIDANKNIEYLEAQVDKTALSEMRNVFFALIQEQTKTKMLAEVNDEYVFKLLSAAKIPEENEGPNRALICIVLTALGGFLSLMFVLLRSFVNKDT